jgi:hypothetical protein
MTGDTTMDLDTSGYSTSKGFVDTSFLRASKKGVFESDEDEMSLAEGEDDDEEEGSEGEGRGGVRRSRRKTKGKRLQFWKNERAVYTKGKMMGLLIANETPAKPKPPKRKQKGASKTKGEESKKRRKTENLAVKKLELESEDSEEGETKHQIPPEIPKQFKYLQRCVSSLLCLSPLTVAMPMSGCRVTVLVSSMF